MTENNIQKTRNSVISTRTTQAMRAKLDDLTRHFAEEFGTQVTITQTLEKIIAEAWDRHVRKDGAGQPE